MLNDVAVVLGFNNRAGGPKLIQILLLKQYPSQYANQIPDVLFPPRRHRGKELFLLIFVCRSIPRILWISVPLWWKVALTNVSNFLSLELWRRPNPGLGMPSWYVSGLRPLETFCHPSLIMTVPVGWLDLGFVKHLSDEHGSWGCCYDSSFERILNGQFFDRNINASGVHVVGKLDLYSGIIEQQLLQVGSVQMLKWKFHSRELMLNAEYIFNSPETREYFK